MEKYDLSKVHSANLAMLKEIDRICRKYKLKYMLDSGTLLGCIRHKGFIPWDDDVDIVFTRRNLEKFLRVAPRELPEGMSILMPEDMRKGRAFYDFTPRVIYENSRMHDNNFRMDFYEGKLNHLWVDLFCLDRLPDSKGGAALSKFIQKVIYGFSIAHRDTIDFSKYSKADKLRVKVLTSIGRFIPMPVLFRLQRAMAMKDDRKSTKHWYYSNYQPDYLYVTLEDEWLTDTVDMPFEDTVLMVPKGYKHTLELVYGDWEKLPPEEKRVPAHSSIDIEVDL